MSKKCEVCGRFMHAKLHGACFKCLRDGKKYLPPALRELSDAFDVGQFHGEIKKSVRGILRSAMTLIHDADWYAVQWDPMGNIFKVLESRRDRPYLTDEMVEELAAIMSECVADDMKKE